MSQSCPISFFKVDETIARINAAFITLLLIIFLFTFSHMVLYFLFYDFFVRLFTDKKYSAVYHLSRVIKKILQLKTEMVDGGAKRLATYFGFVFISLMIIETWLKMTALIYITAVVLLTCTTLEVLFHYCVGCKIYYLIKKIYPSFNSYKG